MVGWGLAPGGLLPAKCSRPLAHIQTRLIDAGLIGERGLKRALPIVLEFIQSGLTTGIGMDATTLNEDEDMFAEIRLALRLQMSPFIESDCLSVEDVFSSAAEPGCC